jgi:hypothetical protein
VRKVLACNNRDGETVDGKVVDKLAPDVVIARFMSGTASSIRSRTFLISWIMRLISASFSARALTEMPPLRANSSAVAAFSSRRARFWMSYLRDLVRDTADSNDVLPRAALSLSDIAFEILLVVEANDSHQFYHINCRRNDLQVVSQSPHRVEESDLL